MSCFRLYTTNYLDINTLANNDVTSADSDFPVTNVYNKIRRSKVWRSAGYFEVTATNNTIIFEETAGTPLTATITAGEYTSISAMSTAIKNALDSAGASTYTVLNDSTTGFKFKITSNGGGGGGIFNLKMGDASNTCEDLLGFDSANLSGSLNYTGSLIKINTGEAIIFDMGLSTKPKGFALIGPRNSPLKISPNATIRLQGNHTNTWTSPVYNQTVSYDDQALYIENENNLSTVGLRYWRVSFEDQNPNGYIEVGSLLLGDFFNPSRGRANFPLTSRYIDRSVEVFSEGGQTFSDVFPQSQSYSVEWRGLQKADIEAFDLIFQRFGTVRPFFVSMDDNAVYSSKVNRRVKFVKFVQEPQYSLVSPDNFTMSMALREEL